MWNWWWSVLLTLFTRLTYKASFIMGKDHNLQPPGCQIIVKMPWSLAFCVVALERFPTNSHTLLTSSSSLLPVHWDRHSWEINLQILLAAVCLQLVLCIISLLTTLSKIIPTFSKCAQWSSSPPRSCFELSLKKEKGSFVFASVQLTLSY